MAESYEEYQIKAMIFEYKSLCSDTVITAGTSLGMGSVIMGTNYNPYNDPFVDKRTMENYEGSSSKKPSQNNIHVVDVSKGSTPLHGPKWVRHGAVPDGADSRLYDMGIFSIATVGQDPGAAGTIGELWIAYEVEFFKPRYAGSVGGNLLYDHYTWIGPTTTLAPFGTTIPPSGILRPNNVAQAGTYITSSGVAGLNRLNFNSTHQGMTFMIYFQQVSRGIGIVNRATLQTASTNISAVVAFRNDSTNASNETLPTSAPTALYTQVHRAIIVRVNPSPNGPWYLDWSYGAGNIPGDAGVAGIQDADLFITQINGTDEGGPFWP